MTPESTPEKPEIVCTIEALLKAYETAEDLQKAYIGVAIADAIAEAEEQGVDVTSYAAEFDRLDLIDCKKIRKQLLDTL